MTYPTERIVATLLPVLMRHLRTHPQGVSEYELIQLLRKDEIDGFGAKALRTPLGLFRTHFLLFHCLYRLRTVLVESGETLEVNCLRIRLLHAPDAPGVLADSDPMASFYLDLGNLDCVDEAEVHRLMGNFWRMFDARSEREEALEVLGLTDPVSPDEVKRQYRRLAMRHHPDRGGDTGKLQELNAAFKVLDVKRI